MSITRKLFNDRPRHRPSPMQVRQHQGEWRFVPVEILVDDRLDNSARTTAVRLACVFGSVILGTVGLGHLIECVDTALRQRPLH
jgi:hypothetical protein